MAAEANALEVHNGGIYCATSYMPPSPRIGDTQPMIPVKKTAGSPWEVDYHGPPEFNRTSTLRSVKFTTDGRGRKLSQPVSVLVAGTGAWRSLQPKGVMALSRNDASGKWAASVLSTNVWNPSKLNHSQETRMLFDHGDRVTGVHSGFAGSATGRLYALCAAEANSVAYAGVAYGPSAGAERMTTERPAKDHGIFRRVDGPNARWELVPVKEWEDPQRPGRSLRTAQLRGLTAAPAPDGKGGEIGKSSWYLVRYADGTYRYQRIRDPANPLTGSAYRLRGRRSIRPSPFPEEAGRVWYFAGFDQTGARGAGVTGPAAWIYKGALPGAAPGRGDR